MSDGYASDEYEELEPSLKNIVEQDTLKWVFVGGKGGVGKTTTSCSLSVALAQSGKKVLLISTDPAHNLSDAFGQQFSKEETKVRGFENLWAMEIDPTVEVQESEHLTQQTASMIAELSSSIPGIDEAMSFAELMKQVQNMKFDIVVFDTAPTGHTLRLLSFPSLLQKGIPKILKLKDKFGGMLSGIQNMMGGAGAGGAQMPNFTEMLDKLEQTKKVIDNINEQFQDPDLTTFVCVCIPEFLSLFETERLVQQLTKFGIDTHNIVVNQVLFPEEGTCRQFQARVKMQQKYLDQIMDLYEDFNVKQMPLLDEEVRGAKALKNFASLLLLEENPRASTEDNFRKLFADFEATLSAKFSDGTVTIEPVTSKLEPIEYVRLRITVGGATKVEVEVPGVIQVKAKVNAVQFAQQWLNAQ